MKVDIFAGLAGAKVTRADGFYLNLGQIDPGTDAEWADKAALTAYAAGIAADDPRWQEPDPEIIVQPDLSGALATRHDGASFSLGGLHPETQEPWASEDQLRAYAVQLSGRPGSWSEPKPEGQFRTVVTRTEYYGLFTPLEEAAIRIAGGVEVTSEKLNAAADEAAKAALMQSAALGVMLKRTDALQPHDTIDLANPQTEAGLQLLVGAGLLTAERMVEIVKGVPA